MGRQPKEEVPWWSVRKQNAVWGGGTFKNPVRFSMHDGPMENVEYMLVNIWCMLNWINGFCHETAEIHFLRIQLLN